MNIQGYSELREPIRTRENCYPLIWGILKYIIRYQCRGRFMSGSYINNNHHKKSSKIITINSFYCYCCYYCCCCCCCCCCGGDDTYYWVYLSSDHPFQVYYKVRQVLLQVRQVLEIATIITKCDRTHLHCFKLSCSVVSLFRYL